MSCDVYQLGRGKALKAVPLKRFIAVCLVLAAVTCLIGGYHPVQGQSSGISFRVLSGGETGLGPIMQQWHAEELAFQGGSFVTNGWWPWGVTGVDYDGDGDIDFLLSHHGRPGSMLVRNQFRETRTITFLNALQDVGVTSRALPIASDNPVIWDFDGDGRLDIAGLSVSTTFFNLPSGNFQLAPFSFGVLGEVNRIIDLNGDGYLDAWGVTRGPGGQRFRYDFIFQPRSRTFESLKSAYEPPAGVPQYFTEWVRTELQQSRNRFLMVRYLTDYDLDGDGVNDVIVKGYGAYGGSAFGRYCISQSAGGGCSDETVQRGLPENGTPILIRDLNADGHLDIIVAVGDAASGLYLNNGSGMFALMGGELKRFLEGRDPYPLRAFPVDFDNDGDLDLVVSKPRLGREEIYENIGTGDVYRLVESIRGWDSNPIALGDLNDDGLIDVVIGGPGPTEVTVLLNTTPNPGNYTNVYPRMNAPNPFAVGARVEVYRAGTMDLPGAKPYFVEDAHPDAQPVHVGVGSERRFDLKVVFPRGVTVRLANVDIVPNLVITPEAPPAFGLPRVTPSGPTAR